MKILRRTALVAALVLLVLACAGWWYVHPSRDSALQIPVGSTRIGPQAVVWAAGRTIHVDARSIDVGRTVDRLAIGRGGVYFVSGERVWFTDLRRVRATPLAADLNLAASADGRYLGVVDRAHGPQGLYGVRRAAVVVLDTTTGRVVLRNGAGMGSLTRDDLGDLYEDAWPHIEAFTDDAVLAVAADGDLRSYPLDGSSPTVVARSGTRPRLDTPDGSKVSTRIDRTAQPVARIRILPRIDEGDVGYLSPSRSTVVGLDEDGSYRVFDARTGLLARPRLPSAGVTMGRWTGPDTFYAAATEVSGTAQSATILTCTRGQSRCRTVVSLGQVDGELVMPWSSTS